jgi:hypothetical protein
MRIGVSEHFSKVALNCVLPCVLPELLGITRCDTLFYGVVYQRQAMLASTSFYLFISAVQGYSEFRTECTTPTSQTSYVSAPNARGTLNILWSCFFTIIACTWTIQHLNVPEQPNEQRSRDQRWYETWRSLKSLWRSIKWMLITIVAPEYIFGKALADLYAAIESKRRMQIFAKEDGVEWGLTHAFFANMGGFVLSQRCLKLSDNDRYSTPAFIEEHVLAPTCNCYEVSRTVLQRDCNERSETPTVPDINSQTTERIELENLLPRPNPSPEVKVTWGGLEARRISMPRKQAEAESILMLPNNTWETTILTRSGGIFPRNILLNISYLANLFISSKILPLSSPLPPSRVGHIHPQKDRGVKEASQHSCVEYQ